MSTLPPNDFGVLTSMLAAEANNAASGRLRWVDLIFDDLFVMAKTLPHKSRFTPGNQ